MLKPAEHSVSGLPGRVCRPHSAVRGFPKSLSLRKSHCRDQRGWAMADRAPVSLGALDPAPRTDLEPIESHPPAVIAGFSGWLLDAFDFFLVTFCLTAMAREFHKTDAQ